jgi:hypothetical protein
VLDKLLADADCAGKGLDVWLREKFFEQHAKRFHHRPFIWHVWDGLKDGFAALVNYHKLDAKNLERLIHTYLGDWIRQQEAGVRQRRRRRPHPPGRRAGPEAPPGAHPGRRAALRHLCALEAAGRAAHRLEPRPQRRRAPEHPPLHDRRGAAPQQEAQAQHHLGQGPRQGRGKRARGSRCSRATASTTTI